MRTAIIGSKIIHAHNLRFEGKHYLNDNSFLSLQLEGKYENCVELGTIANVFNPPVFKRQFCKKTPRAVPYFQSSDVQNAEEFSNTFVFKRQAETLNLLVKQGDVLVTGFGTIGNTRLVSKHQDGVCYANNVCRIRRNNDFLNGYIYAFMSSKYGIAQLNKNASGSVVRYIESPGIKKTLIPNFPKAFQMEVDNLIQKSARLKEEATDALDEAHTIFEQCIRIERISNLSDNKISIQSILSAHNKRFEGSYYASKNRRIYNYITSNFEYKTLGYYAEKIFRPGIFKRDYVKNGVTFLGGADILMAIPSSEKQLSYKQVEKMPELMTHHGWILVTCGGTIGNTVFIDKQLEKCAISQHVMRIVPNEDTLKGYIYAVLSSEIGKQLITLYSTGSVIPQVESHHLERIPIPTLAYDEMNRINDLVNSYVSKNEDSKMMEIQAISMVESEIEKWNKN